MRLSASQLNSFSRCPRAYRFERIEHQSGVLLSATAFGTVIHHAVHAFERQLSAGKTMAEALETAEATFEYFWHPTHVSDLCGSEVQEWIKRHTWGSLFVQGVDTLRKYADVWALDSVNRTILSLEHPFEVGLDGTEHTLSGFVDRLIIRKKGRVWTLTLDDVKTGKRQYQLRQNLQFTSYAYASTKREFWLPFAGVGLDPEELWTRYAEMPRHTRWIDLQEFAIRDGGYRVERDYQRLVWACNEMARSVEADIFPLNISGDTCTYCAHRTLCPDGELGIVEDEAS